MAACRHFVLLLGLVGSVYIMSFFNRWDMSAEMRNEEERMGQRQELRKSLLRQLCDGGRTIEDMRDEELKNLIVDDKHGIIYCYIPKVACTNWKRVMFVLNLSEPYPDPMSIESNLVHQPQKLTLLTSFPRTEMMVKLKHYSKFLFVRDPFVRLLSAYRNKFLHPNEYFYQNFGRTILHLYGNQSDPPKTVEKAFAAGVYPTFSNFVRYLVDPRTVQTVPFEPHWRQMHHLCHPCLIQYDFVGHQETLSEDADQLLGMLDLQNVIKFPPSYENMTSAHSLSYWFETVPLEDRRKLYRIYERDFQLFGYEKPQYLLDG